MSSLYNHTQTHHSRYDSSGQVIGPAHEPLQYTSLTKDRHPCPRRDSNAQSQYASGRRPMPYTGRPLGSALHVYRAPGFIRIQGKHRDINDTQTRSQSIYKPFCVEALYKQSNRQFCSFCRCYKRCSISQFPLAITVKSAASVV